jgi:uncharacterized protein YbaA (DUF1428 family)
MDSKRVQSVKHFGGALHYSPQNSMEHTMTKYADKYIDGFVTPVPKKNLEAYRRHSQEAGEIWRECGALAYVECIADDVKPGKVTSFPQSVKLEADETVAFGWAVYESREHRDTVNEKVMKHPKMANMDPKSFPFDGARMFWGGFKVLIET